MPQLFANLYFFWWTTFSLAWAAFYPRSGEISIVISLIFFSIYIRRYFAKVILLFFIATLFVIYFNVPRDYGSPSNSIILAFYGFSSLILFKKEFLNAKTFEFSEKALIVIISLSFVWKCLIYFGVNLYSEYIVIGPQEFLFYRPFYVDRINITKSDVFGIFSNARFHGPFFEPGILGYVCGVLLFRSKNSTNKLLLTIFGLMAMSVAFYFFLLIFLVRQTTFRFNKLIMSLTIIGITLMPLILLSPNSFYIRSTIGRFGETEHKVFNTRVSIYETEQIKLFQETLVNDIDKLFFGIGFSIPGSGGSGRKTILSYGILFLILYLCVLFRVCRKSLKEKSRRERITILIAFGAVNYAFSTIFNPLLFLFLL